jgi:hypothetical protein
MAPSDVEVKIAAADGSIHLCRVSSTKNRPGCPCLQAGGAWPSLLASGEQWRPTPVVRTGAEPVCGGLRPSALGAIAWARRCREEPVSA